MSNNRNFSNNESSGSSESSVTRRRINDELAKMEAELLEDTRREGLTQAQRNAELAKMEAEMGDEGSFCSSGVNSITSEELNAEMARMKEAEEAEEAEAKRRKGLTPAQRNAENEAELARIEAEMGGAYRRKSRKNRKSRKSRKSRKNRKSRKSRKNRS